MDEVTFPFYLLHSLLLLLTPSGLFELRINLKLKILQLIRLLGWGISRSQGRYLHRENINIEITETDIYVPNEIRTHDRSVRAGEYVP
jgi:hypothetical protein